MVTLEIGSGLTIGLVLGVVIIVGAMLIWVERRLLSFWQERLGPNRVGWQGLLQVVAVMVKIFTKEDWVPRFADRLSFVLAPAIIMTVVLLSFAVIPFAPNIGVVDSNVGVLFVLAMASLGAYSVMLGGLSSDNKYALLGSLRAAAHLVSYEVFIGMSLLGVVASFGRFNLREIVEDQADTWYVVPQFIGFVIFLIAGVAESHRLPFDIPEAEQEICAGYHTEYSGMKFGMFFVAEYIGLVLVSSLITVLFFGGWLGPSFLPPIFWFALKASLFIAFFILLRAAIPRPRYDQLMSYGWLFLLPVSLINLLVTGFIILSNQ